MIIEGLLTTTSSDGLPHVAPMGPVVDEALSNWVLRPFQTSTTFENLRQNGVCVFHVVDDVLPVVQAALSLPVDLAFRPLDQGGWMIESACHWHCLEAIQWNTENPRSEIATRVLASGTLRPFWGWNRAKHAILEATILATRIHLTGHEPVQAELDRLENVVQKTAGERELEAWELVKRVISC